MAESERRRLGKQKLEQIAQIPAFEPADQFMAETLDHVFGELWQRPGLPDRDRRLLSIAVVGALGREFETKTHIRGALASGDVSPAEMAEIVLHVTHYAGWPVGSLMNRCLRESCAELDLEVPGPDAAG